MIFLDRFKFTPTETFGTLYDDLGPLQPLCFTIERPWLDNQPDISCIPIGVYDVEPYNSPTKGAVWQIMNVPNRSNIEIHPANFASELEGCIGVGDSMGNIQGQAAVLNSQSTFTKLKTMLPSNGFILTITGSPT